MVDSIGVLDRSVSCPILFGAIGSLMKRIALKDLWWQLRDVVQGMHAMVSNELRCAEFSGRN
jgi:hypothetical protein